MESIDPYLDSLLIVAKQISQHHYFQQIIAVLVIVAAFLFGRISYQAKISHLINMVNDAQNTRKTLQKKLTSTTNDLKSITKKKKLLYILIVIVIVINIGYIYLTNILYLEMNVISVLVIILVCLIYIIRKKYLVWYQSKLQKQLRLTSVTADTEIKQILQILGKDIEQRIKTMYEGEIDLTSMKQANQPCKLYKCYNEKKVYTQLFGLYEEMSKQIKKVNFCDLCLAQANISTHQLNIHGIENQMKIYEKNIQNLPKLTINNQKQLVNRMLRQYQITNDNINRICKKGCCIKQRIVIEQCKNKYHEKMKRLIAGL